MQYYFHNAVTEKPQISDFKLHNHDVYELLLFISGDAEYVVEGTTHKVEPYDLLIARPNEMHRIKHLSQTPYVRFVLNISDEFFLSYCPEYKIFFESDKYAYNKIESEFVKKSGILDSYTRLKKYTCDFTIKNSPIIPAVITEIMYILCSCGDIYEQTTGCNTLIQNIISYINNNYKNKISLEDIANKNFISKYYMCRLFKEKTGYTLTSYINHKRIINVKDLCKNGISISNAAIESGFGNYSAFYKAYVKEFGAAPKTLLEE